MLLPVLCHLKSALIKSGTTAPMARSKAMPIEPFVALFQSWPSNADLQIAQLRSKAITLLAIVCMLRPSDIAPRTVVMDGESGLMTRRIFSMDQVQFGDKELTLTLHGIKNDTSRTGFVVTLPSASDDVLDPVTSLKAYITRTDHARTGLTPAPVFLSLKAPYHALTADTISQILNDSITQAGLGGKGYSAKCYLHEWDHLQGVTFKDRVSKLKWNMALKKARKIGKTYA